jgi:hypothetical protein
VPSAYSQHAISVPSVVISSHQAVVYALSDTERGRKLQQKNSCLGQELPLLWLICTLTTTAKYISEVVPLNVEIATQYQAARAPQFRFNTNGNLTKEFSGRTVKSMEINEVESTDLSPVALRLRIHFTDGSYLEVDRKTTDIPEVQRKVMHLNLVWQTI